jgi:hypothetical protein
MERVLASLAADVAVGMVGALVQAEGTVDTE